MKKGNVTINNNGTYSFENFGSGIVIFPSKLGYYERTVSSIPRYSPLIFQINLKTLNKTDHDSDGVDTIDEDLNKDNIFGNDDTDSDGIPNYYDTDDDGDGILTKYELDSDNDGNVDDTDRTEYLITWTPNNFYIFFYLLVFWLLYISQLNLNHIFLVVHLAYQTPQMYLLFR